MTQQNQRIQSLMAEREQIQALIEEQLEMLRNQPFLDDPMRTPLVDKDGFPRSDVDVLLIRTARNKIIEQTNDFNKLTNQIAKELENIHSEMKNSSKSLQKDASEIRFATWALVDGVFPDSPAANCGLRRGDMLVKFGNLHDCSERPSRLPMESLPDLVSNNENKIISIMVYRNHDVGEIRSRIVLTLQDPSLVQLELTPRKWNGRGLLGCHLIPLK